MTVEQRSGASAYTTTYTYDNVGNRATMVDGAGTTTYAYNAGNRLTLITDPSSNLTTNTYDNNGNLTVTDDDGTVTTNTWTYDDRLRTVTLATPATTTFTYDGDGLRRQTVTAAGTTNFIWDGQDVLLETDVSNNTQVTYTQTPDLYGQLVSQRRDSTTSFYHHDALGSTLALTGTDESVTDTYRYYAFGETLTSTGSTTNPFQYVGNLGYYNEAALSLQYLRARYYQPGTGRFVSVDPKQDGVNYYLYVANRALNDLDPTGAYAEIAPSCDDHRREVEAGVKRSARYADEICRRKGRVKEANCVKNLVLSDTSVFYIKCQTIHCRGKCGFTASKLGKSIQICPGTWSAPSCPWAGCVIYHELLHLCGLTEEEIEDECLDCGPRD